MSRAAGRERRCCLAFALVMVLPMRAAAQSSIALRLGEEVDSNPGRLVSVSDVRTATRVGMNVDDRRPLGARGAVVSSIDALGRQIWGLDAQSVSLAARVAPSAEIADHGWLGLSLGTRDRLEHGFGCASEPDVACPVAQDYGSVFGDALGSFSAAWGELGASAGLGAFWFPADTALSRVSPRVGLWSALTPDTDVRLAVGYDLAAHRYRGFDTLLGRNGGIYVDETVHRRDRAHDVWATARWTPGTWRLALRYDYLRNDSSSAARSYDRHVLDPSITGVLPIGSLLVRLSGRVVRARYDIRRGEDASLNVDDDARNRVGVALEHPLAGVLGIEAGYTYFVQEQRVSGGDSAGSVVFQRHLVHVALVVIWDQAQ